MNTAKPLYHGYRYPAEIVSHAVWLYFRFTLSHRDVEERRAARGSSSPTSLRATWPLARNGSLVLNTARTRA